MATLLRTPAEWEAWMEDTYVEWQDYEPIDRPTSYPCLRLRRASHIYAVAWGVARLDHPSAAPPLPSTT